MDNSRKWVYTLGDIAKASGLTVEVVRDRKQANRLIPNDLKDVAWFIVLEDIGSLRGNGHDGGRRKAHG